MASVDLSELIPNLEGALTVPGTTSPYANASDAEWVTKLANGFWSALLEGVFTGYSVDEDGIVTPDDGGDSTFSRELQQVVVIYAAINVVESQLLVLKTRFKAEAGPVSYETEQASQVLTSLLKSLERQKNVILDRYSDVFSSAEETYYTDAMIRRRHNTFSPNEGNYWIGY